MRDTSLVFHSTTPCQLRAYSTSSSSSNLYLGHPVAKLYTDIIKNKAKIVSENKGKAGIYM